MHITFDPAKPLLGIYPKGALFQLSTRAHVGVCRAALLVVPQTGEDVYTPAYGSSLSRPGHSLTADRRAVRTGVLWKAVGSAR